MIDAPIIGPGEGSPQPISPYRRKRPSYPVIREPWREDEEDSSDERIPEIAPDQIPN